MNIPFFDSRGRGIKGNSEDNKDFYESPITIKDKFPIFSKKQYTIYNA